MNVRRYIDSDYPHLEKWLSSRGMEAWPEDDLPLVGYVAFEYGSVVAMGFLRMVEKRSGMIDALCTNPNVLPEKRSAAIDAVVEKLIHRAKELNMIGIVCFSEDKNTLERSKKFGFKLQPEKTIIGLSLGE